MPINKRTLERLRANDEKLVNLQLPPMKVTLEDMQNLADAAEHNTYLKILILSEAGLDDNKIRPLLRLKNLTTLTLTGNSITDKGVEEIVKQLPNLQTLGLEDNQVTDDGMKHLAGSRLKILIVSYNLHTEKGVKEFLENTTLTRVDVSPTKNRTEISAILINKLKEQLEKNEKNAESSLKISGQSIFPKASDLKLEQPSALTPIESIIKKGP